MSRSFGDRLFTSLSPMKSSPSVISSRPATMRSAVVFPQPDGPTSTRNSPSWMSSVRSKTGWTPLSYTLSTSLNATSAMDPPDMEQIVVVQRLELVERKRHLLRSAHGEHEQ